jgi:hypothetical protein
MGKIIKTRIINMEIKIKIKYQKQMEIKDKSLKELETLSQDIN